MASNQQLSIDIAKQLLNTGVLTVPLLLAAVKYFVDDRDFSTSSDTRILNLGMMIILGYVSLLAMIYLAGHSLLSVAEPRVKASIYMLEAFSALIGVAIASLLQDELPKKWGTLLTSFMVAFWLFFFVLFGLSVMANPVI